MKYFVRRGYSYVDINGRNQVYGQGEEFAGVVDTRQKWKLGEMEQEVENVGTQTKKAKTKTKKSSSQIDEYDEMDEGEETE
jgi:hypothetical protein